MCLVQNRKSVCVLHSPAGDLEVGTVIPNIGPCGKHPYFVPDVTEANPNAIASSAACCLFNATFNINESPPGNYKHFI